MQTNKKPKQEQQNPGVLLLFVLEWAVLGPKWSF
jgi:hypothetical protein